MLLVKKKEGVCVHYFFGRPGSGSGSGSGPGPDNAAAQRAAATDGLGPDTDPGRPKKLYTHTLSFFLTKKADRPTPKTDLETTNRQIG